MSRAPDKLVSAIEELQDISNQPSAGCEIEWTKQTANALDSLQWAMGQHIGECESKGGMYSKIDLTRPGLARQVAALRQAHLELPFLVNMLQHQVLSAAEAFSIASGSDVQASDLPPARQAESVIDFDAIRQCSLDLVQIVRNHWQHEVDLLQESVTTDLGAGD